MNDEPKLSWKVLLVGLLPVGVLLAVLGAGFRFDPHQMDKPLDGKPAPKLELPELDSGELVSLDSFRGKPVVLNFWATWCLPCADEHPLLLQAARAHRGEVQFVSVVYQDKNEVVRAWLERHGGQGFPTLVDVNAKAAIAFGVYGVPETYFIDKDGVIRGKHVGPVPASVLRERIGQIL